MRFSELVEARRVRVSVMNGKPIDVLQNASKAELLAQVKLGSVRGLSDDRSYWTWQGRDATHYEVTPQLGLTKPTTFFLSARFADCLALEIGFGSWERLPIELKSMIDYPPSV